MHLFWKTSAKAALTSIFLISIAGETQAIPAAFHTQYTHSAVSTGAVNNISGLWQKRVFAQIEGKSEGDNHQQRERKLEKTGQRRKISPELARKLQETLDKDVKELDVTGATVGIISPQGIWKGGAARSN